ncbi:MAG TPA: PD-(D/E)XK nuclease family protein [Acidimicrobiales bacterium]
MVEALGDVLAGPLHPPSPDGIAALRAELDDAARAATVVGGWSADEPLRLSKHLVTGLLRCPRRALGEDQGTSDEIIVGWVVDAAAKLATVSPRRTITVDTAVAFLTALGDSTVADHLADLGSAAARLKAEAAMRIDRLAAAGLAGIDPGWWPRVEDPVRVALGGGAVTVAGRMDVLLGGPPTGRPGVILEVKGGRWYDGMRADGHLYALMVALRDGEVPASAVTIVSDGTSHVERIRPALLQHAAERLDEAMGIAARLAAGEPPAMHPGAHCQHCPVRPDCPVGRAWRPGTAEDAS